MYQTMIEKNVHLSKQIDIILKKFTFLNAPLRSISEENKSVSSMPFICLDSSLKISINNGRTY